MCCVGGKFGWFRRSLCDSVLEKLYILVLELTQAMSHSPTASISNSSESASKKRKTVGSGDLSMAPSSQQQPHIPKRGARACTSCRKGKNRCEGEVRPVLPVRYPSTHRGPSIPSPARLFINRLLVVDVKQAVLLAFSKSQRKRMYKDCPQQVSSMPFPFIPSSLYLIFTLVDAYPDLRASIWYQPLSLCHFSTLIIFISGHAKPDDWHAVFSRQDSVSCPNSKRQQSTSSALSPSHGGSS